MLLPFKTYGFTAQELCFRVVKPMFLQPKTYVFISNNLISSFKNNAFLV